MEFSLQCRCQICISGNIFTEKSVKSCIWSCVEFGLVLWNTVICRLDSHYRHDVKIIGVVCANRRRMGRRLTPKIIYLTKDNPKIVAALKSYWIKESAATVYKKLYIFETSTHPMWVALGPQAYEYAPIGIQTHVVCTRADYTCYIHYLFNILWRSERTCTHDG